MRITAIRLERLVLPLDPPFSAAWDPEPRRSFEATLVRVGTDEGLVGVGSGDTMDGFPRFEHLFVGRDPLDLERHVRALETITFHAGRYWPLETALWDLGGQAQDRPVAALLGGRAERVPAYASCGVRRGPAEQAEAALARREEGFRALKIRIRAAALDDGLAAVTATREAVGDTMEIIVDLNEGWRMAGDVSPPIEASEARRAAECLAELGVLWLEEPLPAEDVEGHVHLRSVIRVAGGEMARTTAELEALLAADALDVYQPDAVLAVGILRARDLAERVLARGRWFAPHTWTNGIGVLANLHLTAAVGGGPFLEFPYDPPAWSVERRDFMLAELLRVDADGFVEVPDRPGLGVVLDEDAVARYRVPVG